jgi:hypothetical protein
MLPYEQDINYKINTLLAKHNARTIHIKQQQQQQQQNKK